MHNHQRSSKTDGFTLLEVLMVMAVLAIGILAVMTAVSRLAMRHAQVEAGPLQSMLEVIVETIANQVREITGSLHPAFLPLLSTLFLFLVVANLSAILPGVKTPTAHIETPAALAVLVFLSTHFFGIKSRGLTAYLRHYTQPSILLMPLNVLSEVTRTFSLMIRLFGNMMSHELVLTIIVMLAGLLLPIPFLLLGVRPDELTGYGPIARDPTLAKRMAKLVLRAAEAGAEGRRA